MERGGCGGGEVIGTADATKCGQAADYIVESGQLTHVETSKTT